MRVSDIKAGYLLDFGEDGKAVVNYNNEGKLGICTGDKWMNVEDVPKYFKRVKVFGRTYNAFIHMVDTYDRDYLGVITEIPFEVGDIVKVVSETSGVTQTSVFKPGYIGEVTRVDKKSYGVVLDDKPTGLVAVEDLELYEDC